MIKIVLIVLAFALVANGQEQKGGLPRDTLADRMSIAQPGSLFSINTSLPPLSLAILDGTRLDLLTPSLVPPPQFKPWMLETKADILSPWKLELKEQEKYRTLYSIFGSIEVGGVAYLGYRFIKQHGFK